MIQNESGVLREWIRILVRNLGVLEKNDASCCCVTLTQCHAIVEIGRKEKISLIDLAKILGLDKSTMSRTVNNLVDSGLAVRDLDSGNRRYVVIRLTDKGKKVFLSTENTMERYYADILGAIPESKREQVLESLQILTDAIRKTKCC